MLLVKAADAMLKSTLALASLAINRCNPQFQDDYGDIANSIFRFGLNKQKSHKLLRHIITVCLKKGSLEVRVYEVEGANSLVG